jgi:hypothetical protein
MKTRRWMFFVSQVALVAACGARTGLLVPIEHDAGSADVGEEPDAAEEPDASEEDALPTIDVFVPPDAPNPCPDAGSTLIYVITEQNVLMSFYPPTAEFATIGTISCPSAPGDSPFSMAVDHMGTAYVAFDSGNVFRVSTLDASCQASGRVPSPGVFQSGYGMGFSANVGADRGFTDDGGDAGDNVETLYLAGDPGGVGVSPIVLGSMDTTSFNTTTIGVVTPSIYGSELTGTGGGQLFGFYSTVPLSGGTFASAAIGQIDRTTGQLVAMSNLPGVDIAGGWAFAFWGGDFYTFTAPGGDGTDTIVQRFSPSDGSVVQVATTSGLTVVGAGVSTCAPQQ